MITLYKYKADIPYSLHDIRICRIENVDNILNIYFENGYVECKEYYQQIKGNITIEEVNFDFCLLIK